MLLGDDELPPTASVFFPRPPAVPACAVPNIVTHAVAAAPAAQAVHGVFAEELVALPQSHPLFEIVPPFVRVPVA